jgi:hypothetical protein
MVYTPIIIFIFKDLSLNSACEQLTGGLRQWLPLILYYCKEVQRTICYL